MEIKNNRENQKRLQHLKAAAEKEKRKQEKVVKFRFTTAWLTAWLQDNATKKNKEKEKIKYECK